MIECDRVQLSLSAWIDDELSAEEAREVETHMASCQRCRQAKEGLMALDMQLASQLQLNDVDAKCAAILAHVQKTVPKKSSGPKVWMNAAIALAVAASLMLVLLPFFEENANDPKGTAVWEARLVRATGPIQAMAPGDKDWKEIAPSSGEAFALGSRLKTQPGVRCEVQTTNKGLIRLNESAEVVLSKPNHVELVTGQMWYLGEESTQIDVKWLEGGVNSPTMMTFQCPSDTEIQCRTAGQTISCSSLSPSNAEATMIVGLQSCSVSAGETLSIDGASNISRSRDNVPLHAKIWQLPLLAIEAVNDSELIVLLDRILAPIGMSKATHWNEEQIRSLGPSGAIPLLAYVAAKSTPEDLHLRRNAIRLASDLADERCVRFLKQLSQDPDDYIASMARTTLGRIASSGR